MFRSKSIEGVGRHVIGVREERQTFAVWNSVIHLRIIPALINLQRDALEASKVLSYRNLSNRLIWQESLLEIFLNMALFVDRCAADPKTPLEIQTHSANYIICTISELAMRDCPQREVFKVQKFSVKDHITGQVVIKKLKW